MMPVPAQATGRSVRTTLLIAGLGGLLLLAAFLNGIADNPVGIALVYAGITLFYLAWVHPWRSLKRFLLLFGIALVGFPVAAILHNLFYALAELAAGVPALATGLGFLDGFFFIVGILVCPPGAAIGAVGAGWLGIQRLRQRQPN